nr:hypothetical protein [uncultured bacterium]
MLSTPPARENWKRHESSVSSKRSRIALIASKSPLASVPWERKRILKTGAWESLKAAMALRRSSPKFLP